MTGLELRSKRKDLDWTQEELARALGVTANTVARWERDEVPFPPFLELAMKQLKGENTKRGKRNEKTKSK